MRAITRALPLLRPAHSMKIVRLPSGLDPDDLIKRDGPRAMEALLSQPQSLLDVLWEHERDAAPLTSPEDKAGLKAGDVVIAFDGKPVSETWLFRWTA